MRILFVLVLVSVLGCGGTKKTGHHDRHDTDKPTTGLLLGFTPAGWSEFNCLGETTCG